MPIQIPVDKIREISDPFENPPWEPFFNEDEVDGTLAIHTTVNFSDITTALRDNDLAEIPYQLLDKHNIADSMEYHIARIAYLVKHDTSASDAIGLDVGIPALGCHVTWCILDGNHRLAAAIYRGDKTIYATVDGDLNYARELFGVDVTENYG